MNPARECEGTGSLKASPIYMYELPIHCMLRIILHLEPLEILLNRLNNLHAVISYLHVLLLHLERKDVCVMSF